MTDQEKEAYRDYIAEHSDVGLITLFFMHTPEDVTNSVPCFNNKCVKGFFRCYTRFLLGLVIVVQLVIPIFVFVDKERDYDEGTCPKTADNANRALAFFVGAIYLTKLTFLFVRKLQEGGNAAPLKEDRKGGILQLYVECDRFMNIVYESVVYLLNMWIVFITPEALDMVLNSLAMEFILQLDDEVKTIYIKIFPPGDKAVQAYMDANNDDGQHNISWCCYWLALSLAVSIFVLEFLAYCAMLVGIVWLPLCKAGGYSDDILSNTTHTEL